jgi:hypothetical protein
MGVVSDITDVNDVSNLDDIIVGAHTDMKKIKKELEKILVRNVLSIDLEIAKEYSQQKVLGQTALEKIVVTDSISNAIQDLGDVVNGKSAKAIVNKSNKLRDKMPDFDLGASL